jgi:hypothetical protein
MYTPTDKGKRAYLEIRNISHNNNKYKYKYKYKYSTACVCLVSIELLSIDALSTIEY